jgi:hypothetical protein
LIQSAGGLRVQQGSHPRACRNSVVSTNRKEDGISAHRVAHGDETSRAFVEDHQGEIAFKVLEAFEPTLTIDGKGKRSIVFFFVIANAIVALEHRQVRHLVQASAQLRAIVKPAHKHSAHASRGHLHHQRRSIVLAVIAHPKLGFGLSSKDCESDIHGTAPLLGDPVKVILF